MLRLASSNVCEFGKHLLLLREEKSLFCLRSGGLSQGNLCAGAALLHMAKRGQEGKLRCTKLMKTPAEIVGSYAQAGVKQTFMLNPISAAHIQESHHNSKA